MNRIKNVLECTYLLVIYVIFYPLSEVKSIKVLFEIPKFDTELRICPIESSISAKASPNLTLLVLKDHFEPEKWQKNDHL